VPPITIIADESRTVDGVAEGDRILIDAERLPDAIGWELKPEGLCREDVCVPVRDSSGLFVDGRLDVVAVAGALGRLTAVDADGGLVAVALPAEQRRQALDSLQAPPFSLPDLDGAAHGLEEWRGKKKLLVAFASW
jgi:hypothetical protein